MSADPRPPRHVGPELICFDGSDDAAHAIAIAGELIAPRRAVVLTVWEPVGVWEPYDPGAVLSSAMAKLGSAALGLDEIAGALADERLSAGLALARAAGFDVEARVARGKTWQAICETADELDSRLIILGTRALTAAVR